MPATSRSGPSSRSPGTGRPAPAPPRVTPQVRASTSARSVSAATAAAGNRSRAPARHGTRAGGRGVDDGHGHAATVTRAFCGDRLRTSSLRASSGLAACELRSRQRDGDDGRGLHAQDAGAEPDRVEPRVPRRRHLRSGEAAFGAHQQRRRLPPSGRDGRGAPLALPARSGAGAPGRARPAPGERARGVDVGDIGAPALAGGLPGDLLPAARRVAAGRATERAVSTGTMRATPSSVVFWTSRSMRSPRGPPCSNVSEARARASRGRRRAEHQLGRVAPDARIAPRPRGRAVEQGDRVPGRARSTRARWR